MSEISNVTILEEFTNDNVVYGIYWAEINGQNKLFVRNGNNIAAVSHKLGEPASKSLNKVLDSVAEELIRLVNAIG